MNNILTSIEYALLRSGFKDVFEATCNGMEKQGMKAKLILLLGVAASRLGDNDSLGLRIIVHADRCPIK